MLLSIPWWTQRSTGTGASAPPVRITTRVPSRCPRAIPTRSVTCRTSTHVNRGTVVYFHCGERRSRLRLPSCRMLRRTRLRPFHHREFAAESKSESCVQARQDEVSVRWGCTVLGEHSGICLGATGLQDLRRHNVLGAQRTSIFGAHAQGVTTCLYPLSVIKTRQMALAGSPPGLSVRAHIPRHLECNTCVHCRHQGVRGA